MSNELKSASSVKTGKKFSEKRNYIGFTIEEISEKLFINKDYISAIEKGNYSVSFQANHLRKLILINTKIF